MNFGFALESLKSGIAVARKGWNGNGLKVKLQAPDEHSKMSLPYLYIEYPADAKTTPGASCPWFPSTTDLMADDWYSEGGSEQLSHVDRMRQEHCELCDRLNKLDAFINTAKFNYLPAPEKARMKRQLIVMRDYVEVLGNRIACASTDKLA